MFLAGLLDVRRVLVHRPFDVVQVVFGLLAAVGIVFRVGTGGIVAPLLTVLRLLFLAGFFSLSLRLRLLVLTGPSPAARSWRGPVAELVGGIQNLGHLLVERLGLLFLGLDQGGKLFFRLELGLEDLLDAAGSVQGLLKFAGLL